jgi:hypothetical protein
MPWQIFTYIYIYYIHVCHGTSSACPLYRRVMGVLCICVIIHTDINRDLRAKASCGVIGFHCCPYIYIYIYRERERESERARERDRERERESVRERPACEDLMRRSASTVAQISFKTAHTTSQHTCAEVSIREHT